jgi:hypothetical protein
MSMECGLAYGTSSISTRLCQRPTLSVSEHLYAERAIRPKIIATAIHPYISGQPFRVSYVERVYEKINRFSGVVH